MYEIMNASPATLIIVMSAMLVTPLYVLATYVFSGASARKGMQIASAFLVWGAVMTWVCLAGVPGRIGPLGQLIIPVCWFTPSLLLVVFRGWFLSHPLSQRWLIGLQLWRVIGGVFLIEMSRGNIPGVFALPAGIGDVLAGVMAGAVLLAFRSGEIPRWAVLAVIVFGVADFVSAFFFGTTSSPGPQQLFESSAQSSVLVFPTGLIPLFLVPYAIFFHTLSWLTLRASRSGAGGA